MSSNHCSQLDLFDHIHDFVVASADRELTKDQWAKFEEFLWENDDACQMYLEYAQESNVLQTILESMPAENSLSSDIICVEPRESASPTFLSNTFHGIVGYLCDGIPQGYLIGAVITGLVLLILANVYVSDPARGTRRSSPAAVVAQPKAKYVGRITGMVDCKIGDSRVFLGQKLNLTSGQAEITYDTGAKVILQGPVMYEVETNGGYLAVGKLTGKLEKKLSVVSDQQSEKVASETNPKSKINKSQISNPQSLIPNPFVIHTPTATVTDLGTEFGVEVDNKGVTESHVFSGAVRVSGVDRHGDGNVQERVIHAGDSIRVDGADGGIRTVKSCANRFMRVLPNKSTAVITADSYSQLVLSMKPVVYYRMEQWPRDEKHGGYMLVDSAPGLHHGELHVDEAFGPPWPHGKFGGALEFRGPLVNKYENYAVVHDYPQAAGGQLSVSAWVRPVTFDSYATIVQSHYLLRESEQLMGQFYLGVISNNGSYWLAVWVRQSDGRQIIAMRDVVNSATPILRLGQWQHVAFVADGAMLRLYRNGVEIEAKPCRGVVGPQIVKGLGIGCLTEEIGGVLAKRAPGAWNGGLDEIALFNHALTAEQVRQLYTGTSLPGVKKN